MGDANSRLVYSSDDGRVRPPSRPAAPARRAIAAVPRARGVRQAAARILGDGVVRLHRDRSGRGGKPGTIVVGLPGSDADLDAMLKRCKQRLGAGGTRRGRALLIQGDHREQLRTLLEADGHTVKLAGG